MRTSELHRLVRDEKMTRHLAVLAMRYFPRPDDRDERDNCMQQMWLEIGLAPKGKDPKEVARLCAKRMYDRRWRERRRCGSVAKEQER